MKLSLFSLVALTLTSISALAADYNHMVLDAIKAMPNGGRYSKLDDATLALGKSMWTKDGVLEMDPSLASPVYCSGASYQAFLEVIRKLQLDGKLDLSEEATNGLLVNMQPDGTDTWGRWNSNGPGTSRLFFELGLGRNFVRFQDGKPGDFLKMFFNQHIGKFERGHSVVYLGMVRRQGKEFIRYWSSDEPAGRGIYEKEKSRVVRVIFSRLENPENLNNITSMPKTDAYLASMLTEASTYEEMLEKIGLK